MRRVIVGVLILSSMATGLAFVSPRDRASVRPFIALAHPGQVIQPHQATDTNLTAFFLYDGRTKTLRFTVSEGDVNLHWAVRGPAGPGETGPEIGFGLWSPGQLEVGPLTRAQVRDLRKGRLYVEFIEPVALPEPPRAMRGQILPVPGVRY